MLQGATITFLRDANPDGRARGEDERSWRGTESKFFIFHVRTEPRPVAFRLPESEPETVLADLILHVLLGVGRYRPTSQARQIGMAPVAGH